MEDSNDFEKLSAEKREVKNCETNIATMKDNNRTSSKICMHYLKYEFCSYGDNCKFLHCRKKVGSKEFMSNQFPTPRSRTEKDKTQKVPQIPNIKKNFPIRKEQALNNLEMPSKYKQVCRYYKAGYCNEGEKCLYNHSFEYRKRSHFFHADKSKNSYQSSISKERSIPVCQYFKRGFCNKGDRCKFYHQSKYTPKENIDTLSEINKTAPEHSIDHIRTKSIEDANCVENVIHRNFSTNNSITTTEIEKNNCDYHCESIVQNSLKNVIQDEQTCPNIGINSKEVNIIENSLKEYHCHNTENKCSEYVSPSNYVSLNSVKLTDDSNISKESKISVGVSKVFIKSLSEAQILQQRLTEIAQLKKRFPSHEVIEENKSFSFDFQPSDPDWPFDLKTLKLQVKFPETYPIEVCDITIIRTAEYIPETLLKYLEQSISAWLNMRHEASIECKQVELIFRPFLKWFDRNLEELFKCGLKRDKQVEVNADDEELASIQDLNLSHSETTNLDRPVAEENYSLLPEISTEEKYLEQKISKVSISEQKNSQNTPIYNSQKHGVKALFIGLELMEGVAALSCTKVAAMLQCIRCKTSSNIKSSPNKNNTITCSKCSKIMEFNFNPSLLHQFSNVLGTMHLIECQVVDINLVECAFLVDCLNCSKQVGVDGIHYGQKQKLWCMFCNQKLIIGIGSVKFQTSGPTYSVAKTVDKAVKKTEKKKDPLIKEGSPLPQFGACKHYKKSNRWLRFPCCGRVYPCDICHEDKEINHEMKFASRMICGFCSKEQPYSKEKPCVSCSSGMVAKSGAHWEGGKGCRNKVKMSRDDKHKFAGISKTTSKKAQNSGNKKK